MKNRNGIAAATVAALVITSSAANADSNLGAFAVGAALGAIINSQVGKNQRQQQQQKSQSSGQSNYQRQQNREVQAALNGFGFPVGTVDGALGQKSRAAISNYQSYMGWQPTGYLDDWQRTQLVSAHQRLEAGGGAAYPEVVANEGTKGLLKAFADPSYANRYRSQSNGAQQAGVFNDQGTVARNDTQAGQIAGGQQQPLTFAPLAPLGQQATAVSMNSHCELVSGMTQANQGVILASNITDPEQALGEQFCEARAFAMTQGQALAVQAGQGEEQLTAACGQVAQAFAPATSQIGTGDVKLVATQAQQIAGTVFSGDMATAAGYGQICLGLGYRKDDAEMALGGAAAMLATGAMPYAELLGHHTRWGFGTPASSSASTSWYETALAAMDQGAQPVFVPSKTAERNAIIRASLSDGVGGGLPPLQASSSGGGLALPALTIGGN